MRPLQVNQAIFSFGLRNMTDSRQDSILGFNLPNNNVSAMSLARTHLEMQTSSLEIGIQCKPPACGRRFTLDPNFSGLGPHF